MEDQEIIELFFERLECGIHELDKKYGNLFRKVSNNILNNEKDTEECLNDSYLAAWNTIPPENPNPLSTYICKIVRNLALKKYDTNRALKRNSFFDVALDELEDCLRYKETVESEASKNELSRLLNDFLSNLNAQSRVLFVRRYWYGDSVSDIATSLNEKPNTVTVRLKRLRTKLRNYMERQDIEL